MSGFAFEQHSGASPERLFDVFADGAGWSRWAGPTVPRSSWEREGVPAPGGVGAIRVLGSGRLGAREEITAYEPPRRLTYRVLSGLPVRDYVGTIALAPVATGGTLIRWSGEFRPALPGTGGLVAGFLRKVLSGYARRASAFAERS